MKDEGNMDEKPKKQAVLVNVQNMMFNEYLEEEAKTSSKLVYLVVCVQILH